VLLLLNHSGCNALPVQQFSVLSSSVASHCCLNVALFYQSINVARFTRICLNPFTKMLPQLSFTKMLPQCCSLTNQSMLLSFSKLFAPAISTTGARGAIRSAHERVDVKNHLVSHAVCTDRRAGELAVTVWLHITKGTIVRPKMSVFVLL
jgi:hypothetical protein